MEKRLIEEGEMETWMITAFGGDRLILVPTPLPASTNASTLTLSGMAHVGQDQFTKKCVTILCARALSVFVMDTYM